MTQIITNDFAVGIVSTDLNGEDVIRTVVRARQQGYTVLVTYYQSNTVIKAAEELGAEIIHPETANPTAEDLKRELVATAREDGYPGLLYLGTSEAPVDLQQCTEAATETDSYLIESDAVSAPRPSADASVLVAIPAYNEADTIGAVIEEVDQYADSVLVVDDGSSDETKQRAEEAGAFVVEHERNQGYGAALKTIFEEANQWNPDHLVVIDGDGQHDVDDIPELVSVQREEDANIVIGSRFGPGDSQGMALYRRLGLEAVNFSTNVCMKLLGSQEMIRDTQSGFRAYDSNAIETLAADETINEGMSASLDIVFHALQHDYDITEVGTTIDYDVDDASTRHPLAHGYGLVGRIMQTIGHERPLSILGVPGFLCIFLGFGFGYWTIINYLSSGNFPVGLGVTTALFVLVGLLSCFTAVILYALKSYIDYKLGARPA